MLDSSDAKNALNDLQPTSEHSSSESDQAVESAAKSDEHKQVVTSKPSYLVGIGASAGGLEALERLFERMPHDTGMAFIVVQHLSPDFKSLMGEVLARWTKMPICTVDDGMPVLADTVYLMPSKAEMIISDGRLLLTARARSDELRLPIDQFLRSLARDAGPQSIAVILSGTGSDGSRGIQEVHAAGGLVLVQSPETAKFDGMPESAIETGVVEESLAPAEIPGALLRYINHPASEQICEKEEGEMTPIFTLLRKAYGIDFENYKPATVARRTDHRMQMCRVADLQKYIAKITDDREELDGLYRDLLIGVTSFFRDPKAFEALETEVLPSLLADLKAGEEFRVWIAGCATGEEAYSLAMLLHEQLRDSRKTIQAKVFATDAHSRSLEVAAAGEYRREAVATVSEERLREYFVLTRDGYRVSPELRNMVVFAQHNIIKDAPFTRMNLISCRNLLIYLKTTAQMKALSLFHFGLKTGGVLFLGSSESPGDLSVEFEELDRRWKMYRKRRDARLPPDLRLPVSRGFASRLVAAPDGPRDSGLSDVFAQALERTLPPSVIVNLELEILHTFGDASKFLKLRSGQPSLGLMDMLDSDLKMAVGAALHRASREKQQVTLNNVQAKREDTNFSINVTVLPLPATRRVDAHSLVQFEENQRPQPVAEISSDLNLNLAARDHIDGLEAELKFTKENLQATIEELETSNEELQATNEELLASNEELQSTNEELHSVNEELYTVNAEYQRKIEELTELTHDMDNLLSSTDVHTMFLDAELRIRRYTPRMGVVFHLIQSDVGRKIHGFMHSIRCADLSGKLVRVLEERQQYEEEVENGEGESFLMRILPYKGDPHERGVVITLIDITGLKEAETRFRNAMEASPNGMLMVCSKGKITQTNSELERIFGYQSRELIDEPLEILIANEYVEQHELLRQEYFQNPYVLRRMGGLPYVWGQHKSGRRIPLDIHVRPISTPHGRQAIASIVDVSQHQQMEASLREKVSQRDHFLATLSHELRNPMNAILTATALLTKEADEASELMRASQIIRRQASQIALLLNDLLDVARVTQGKIVLRLQAVDLAKVCQEATEAVEPMRSEKGHRLNTVLTKPSVWVEADRVRLLQIIENLLTNAIKYTERNGNIDVVIGEEHGMAIVRVRDNGRGMNAELIRSAFDMFVQSDSTLDRSEGGMGVGLTLVRSLVEMHGGTIEASSSGPGLGSEFVVRLPLTQEPPHIPEHTISMTSLSDVTSVILVEDDEDAREMMALLLSRSGHDVVATARDGLEGLEVIRRHRPRVAILDIGLPKLDGYQLARQVRAELGDTVHLIALTGYGRDEDRQSVAKAGFDQHLVKPLQLDQLNRILKDIGSNQDRNMERRD